MMISVSHRVRKYSFRKVGHLKWQEQGCWHMSHYPTVLSMCRDFIDKYPTSMFDIKRVILKDIDLIYGAVYEENDKGDNITIFAEFKSDSDEAEFILRETL